MAYPDTHLLLNMAGPLFAGERWSMGLRIRQLDYPVEQSGQQARCDAYAAAVVAWWGSNNIISSAAKIDEIKLNLIGADGRYVYDWTNIKAYTTPVSGVGTAIYPPQVSLVGTLLTDASRGLANKGRIYLPAPKIPIETATGIMSTANQTGVTTSLKTLLDAINQVQVGERVIIASKVGAGAERDVTAVAVGRALDTMRSRRRSLEEARVLSELAAPS